MSLRKQVFAAHTIESEASMLTSRLPQRLLDLGFVGQVIHGVEVIIPPVRTVPAGPFLMGSDRQHDPHAYTNELPQHTVHLPAFQMAQYPVTVAEYACAVRAGAAPAPPSEEPYGRPTPRWQTQLRRLDHPVVGISWNDATAYVSWLERTTTDPWRLPTETEWEKAARGTDGRIYPWGDAWDKTRANVGKTLPLFGIGTATTPVGNYPSGASPYGVQEMAGNAWEWTSSLPTHAPSDPLQPEGQQDIDAVEPAPSMLRGGSWSYPPQFARAAVRVRNSPDIFFISIGFRLARSLLDQRG
jgi:eukaryotic-like serine/threonine-protein kinase